MTTENESAAEGAAQDNTAIEVVLTDAEPAKQPVEGAEPAKTGKQPLTFATLSGQQIPRYHSMHHRYGDGTLTLLENIKRTGPNSWNEMVTKSDLVNNSTDNDRLYFKALTDGFEMHVASSIDEIVPIVCELRSRFRLTRFSSNINSSCVNELRSVFMLDEAMQPRSEGKGNQRVYIPVFAILAD